jgi:hypothetical protein
LSRNNNRTGAPPHQEAPPQPEKQFDPLHFVAPTEFVDLPSKGIGYPEGHSLHKKDTIEIRYMTAKDEDILSSRTLLKKGVAVERFLDNVIVDKNIKASELFVGDRNALIIASRISGYGANYETRVNCPACNTGGRFTFDLTDQVIHESSESESLNLISNENGTFSTVMPFTKFNIIFKLLVGKDEAEIVHLATQRAKTKSADSSLTDQYKRMIASIEGHSDQEVINKYVNNMPTIDSRHLRACYRSAAPDVKIVQDFNCPSCGHEEGMEVPFGADFFWPDRNLR